MNDIMTGKQQEQEIERIVSALSEMERVHLRSIIYDIVKCYERGQDNSAVIVVGTGDSIEGAISINCDTMQAANLLLGANDFFGYLNAKGAPPKEMFN